MKKLIVFSLLVLAVASVGCSHHKTKVDEGAVTTTSAPNGLQADLEWYKNKPETMEFLITLTNKSNSAVSFKRSSINMTFNGSPMSLVKDNFSGDMAAGSIEKAIIGFQFPTKEKHRSGTAVITFDPVQATGSGDDKPKKLSPTSLSVAVSK